MEKLKLREQQLREMYRGFGMDCYKGKVNKKQLRMKKMAKRFLGSRKGTISIYRNVGGTYANVMVNNGDSCEHYMLASI